MKTVETVAFYISIVDTAVFLVTVTLRLRWVTV